MMNLQVETNTNIHRNAAQPINRNAKNVTNIENKHDDQVIANDTQHMVQISGKKQEIYDLLRKMEMGNTESRNCLQCHKIQPRKQHQVAGSDDIKVVYTPPPTSNIEVRSTLAPEQRETAFFDKTGDAQEHYFKHFAHGVNHIEDISIDNSRDETDISVGDHNGVETPMSYQEGDLVEHAEENGDTMVLSEQGLDVVQDDLDEAIEENDMGEIDENIIPYDDISIQQSTPLDVTVDYGDTSPSLTQSVELVTEDVLDLTNSDQVNYSQQISLETDKSISEVEGTLETSSVVQTISENEGNLDEVDILDKDDVDVDVDVDGEETISEKDEVPSITSDYEELDGSMVEETLIDDQTSVAISEDELVAPIVMNPALLDIDDDTPPSESPEPVSAVAFSATKNKLALATTLGTVQVFILDMLNQAQQEDERFDIETVTGNTKPNSMLWGIVTKTPTLTTNAHVGAINSLYIEDSSTTDPNQMATIVTSGDDSYIRVWSVYIEQNMYIIKLVAAQRLPETPTTAVQVRNATSLMVGYEEGKVDLWNIGVSQEWETPSTLPKALHKTKNTVDTECDIIGIEVSPTGKYMAVCSTGGWMMLYDAFTMGLAGLGDCKNARGFRSKGANVTGVNWNTRETLMLVTTSDSRIRMLTMEKDDEGELVRVEKFKGHTNTKFAFKAQFAGVNNEYVICPCEKSFIYVWKHNVDATKRFHTNEGKVKTNSAYIRFKFNAPTILPFVTVLNPGQWSHIKSVIINRQKNNEHATAVPQPTRGCMPRLRRYSQPQNIEVTELDIQRHILLMGIQDYRTIRYTIISLDVLENHFA